MQSPLASIKALAPLEWHYIDFCGYTATLFGLAGLSFWAEARRSRRDLLQIVEGRVLEISHKGRLALLKQAAAKNP